MVKIKDLRKFTSSAIDVIQGMMIPIAMSSETTGCSASFLGKYDSLIRLLDVLFTLDNMKDIKGSMRSDFSRYKKLIESDSSRNNSDAQKELKEIQLFLNPAIVNNSANCSALLEVRDRLRPIRGYERVFTEILDLIIWNLENNVYVTCDEKFSYIRLIPHIMVIIDGAATDPKSINVFTFKKLNLSGLQKILKSYPLLPLYGDMTLTLHHILALAPHYNKLVVGGNFGFDYAVGGKSCEIDSHPDYNIKSNWSQIRSNHTKFIIQFQLFINQISRSKHYDTPTDMSSISSYGQDILNSAKIATELSIQGLSLLSQWRTYVLLMMAWKYKHPNTTKVLIPRNNDSSSSSSSSSNSNGDNNSQSPVDKRACDEGVEYVRAIERNFTDEELYTLSDIVSLIKSLSSLLYRNHVYLAPLFRMHQHHEIQQLVKSDLLPVLHRVYKRKDTDQLKKLLNIVTQVGDYCRYDVKDEVNDYKTYSRKQGSITVIHKIRVVGLSTARLYLLRSQINELYHNRSVHRYKHGLLGKADLEKDDINSFEIFYNKSYYYNYLLNFQNTVREVSTLGELWYREYHLEMTKCTQFPIESSLPWILAERIISCNNLKNILSVIKVTGNDKNNEANENTILSDNIENVPFIEKIFYILDIYNDVAEESIQVLKAEQLYNEIEAESSLTLLQIVHSIGENIYSYYKDFAALQILDTKVKNRLEDISANSFLTMKIQKYESIAKQTNIKILGKFINLKEIFSEKMTEKIRHDIDMAIKYFEESDCCSLIELQTLLDIIRCTHNQISSVLDIDDYPLLFKDVNEALQIKQSGRITTHLLRMLETDLIPNYAYNSHTNRFVKTCDMILPHPGVPDKAPIKSSVITDVYGCLCCKIFETHGKMGKLFFGLSHVESMISLFAASDSLVSVFIIIEFFLDLLSNKLHDANDYICALKDGMPYCKSPSFSHHVTGCIYYYEEKLISLLEFEDLKPELFQVFREIGNLILLLKIISDALDITISLSTSSKDEKEKNSNNSYDHLINSTRFPLLGAATASLALMRNMNGCIEERMENISKEETKHEREKISEKDVENVTKNNENKSMGNGTFFQIVLKHTEMTLEDRNLFKLFTVDDVASADYENNEKKGIMDPQIPDGFYVMWSALTFLFCLSSSSSSTEVVTDIERFGDGFQTAGCVLLCYLGERELFELNDYNHLILRVHSYDSQSAPYELIANTTGLEHGSGKESGSFLGRGKGSGTGTGTETRKRSTSWLAAYGSSRVNNRVEAPRDVESVIATATHCHHHQQTIFSMLEAHWNFSEWHANYQSISGRKITLFRPLN